MSRGTQRDCSRQNTMRVASTAHAQNCSPDISHVSGLSAPVPHRILFERIEPSRNNRAGPHFFKKNMSRIVGTNKKPDRIIKRTSVYPTCFRKPLEGQAKFGCQRFCPSYAQKSAAKLARAVVEATIGPEIEQAQFVTPLVAPGQARSLPGDRFAA